MYLVKTVSNAVQNSVRRIKVLLFGGADVRTAQQVTPFGIDSAPVKDMIAVYSDTSITGEQVIVGYLNKSLLAQTGELRLYSTDSSNAVQFYAWFKADGTLELNGTADNAVRYAALNTGLQQYNNDVLTKLNMLAAAINAIVPGSVTVPITITLDVSGSKIDEIKTT